MRDKNQPAVSSLRVGLVVLHECETIHQLICRYLSRLSWHGCETIHPLRRFRVSRCSWYSMSERRSTKQILVALHE